LSITALDRMIHFIFRCIDLTHYDLKMIDQRLHIVVNLLFGGKIEIRNIGMEYSLGFFINLIHGLSNDLHTLPHFLVADEITIIHVPFRSDWYLKVKLLVGGVRFDRTHIIVYTRRTQIRSTPTKAQRRLRRHSRYA